MFNFDGKNSKSVWWISGKYHKGMTFICNTEYNAVIDIIWLYVYSRIRKHE